mmetsp:Transcript_43968/g.138193  ORF Transcript_43968/g.138193 Transcript_43968/m.138193 type:complete len:117 (-) Transcript_43968:17-367(-)
MQGAMLRTAAPARAGLRRLRPSAAVADARYLSSVMDSMKGAVAQRQLKQQEQQTRKMMKELAEKDTFHLSDFKAYLDKGMSGWQSYIPGMKETDQYQDLERRKSVLEALTPVRLEA